MVQLYAQISKVGFPVVFVYGLWRGWWYLKPHVALILARVTELTEELEESREQTARATSLAEESHAIAVDALTEARSTHTVLEKIQQDVAEILRISRGE